MRIHLLALTIALVTASGLQAADRQLAHMVYFTLSEDSAANRKALVSACNKHLTDHEGTVYFSAGTLANELNREVNDREFNVALHLVFANKKAHDTYQIHPRHLKFIEENKHLWSKVRVFDSYIPLTNSPFPADAKGFAGMVKCKVTAKAQSQITVEVTEIQRAWRHSKAESPKSLVGKRIVVNGRTDKHILRFLNLVKVGGIVTLDVANKEGDKLTLLELSSDQLEEIQRTREQD